MYESKDIFCYMIQNLFILSLRIRLLTISKIPSHSAASMLWHKHCCCVLWLGRSHDEQ